GDRTLDQLSNGDEPRTLQRVELCAFAITLERFAEIELRHAELTAHRSTERDRTEPSLDGSLIVGEPRSAESSPFARRAAPQAFERRLVDVAGLSDFTNQLVECIAVLVGATDTREVASHRRSACLVSARRPDFAHRSEYEGIDRIERESALEPDE